MICDKEDGSNDQQCLKMKQAAPQFPFNRVNLPKDMWKYFRNIAEGIKALVEFEIPFSLGSSNEWEGHGNTQNEVASDTSREEKVGEQ